MPPLSAAQRNSVSQFVAVTGAPKDIAATVSNAPAILISRDVEADLIPCLDIEALCLENGASD